MTTEDLIAQTAKELKNLISGQTVLGAPLDLGNKAMYTVSRFGLGFGAGSGKGEGGKMGSGEGSGAGAGGAIEPIAVIILHKDVVGSDGVQVIPLRKDNPIAQIINALGENLLPKVLDLMKKDEEAKPAE